MIDVSEDRFEELAIEALDSVPGELAALLDNVVLFVEDEAPDHSPHLLGLYEGIPITSRDSGYTGHLPDRITVFRQPLLARCRSEEELVREVRITVVHEIAHHFGIDDARLHELGYA